MITTNLNYLTKPQQNETPNAPLLKLVKGISPIRKIRSYPLNRKLRILSIDGGGIRAILPTIILAELEERLKKESGNPEASIVDYFDLFAGTSAGSILIALYLTPSEDDPRKPKYSAKEVLEIYLWDGCAAFRTPNPDKSRARSEKYCAAAMEEKLKFYLGENTQLEQLLKPALITAFNATTETPVFFESWQKGNCKAWQVVRASAAAPGLFKAVIVEGYHAEHALIDGSIFAGNPAMCAYAVANNTRFSKIPNCSFCLDFPDEKDLVLLSLGTGKAAASPNPQKGSWVRSMLKNLMSSGIALVDYQLTQLFSSDNNGAYFRLNPTLPEVTDGIDNVGTANVDALCEVGEKYLKEKEGMIRDLMQAIL